MTRTPHHWTLSTSRRMGKTDREVVKVCSRCWCQFDWPLAKLACSAVLQAGRAERKAEARARMRAAREAIGPLSATRKLEHDRTRARAEAAE